MKYRKRFIEPVVREYLTHFPVVAITGPRQSGKSTLLRHLLPNYQYVNFDDLRTRDFFNNDPYGFMQTHANQVIFDEVQKVPELFNFVKIAVDNDRSNYGKFVLTGSSQLTLLKQISESLAGRIGLLTLLPFQFSELPLYAHDDVIFCGSYPEMVQSHYKNTQNWYSSYIDTYLQKDLREIKDIGNLRDFKRFINLLAANTSQQLNMSTYANDLGVSVPTIKNWISVLETAFIVFLLPPFYKNYGKRLTKSPKIYFYDTGLVAYLTAIYTKELFEHGPMTGALFENYIIAEIMKKNLHSNSHAEHYYYRSSDGLEIDLIVDHKTHKELIEIKSGATFTTRMNKPIEKLLEDKDNGYILYRGETISYKPTMKVMNYKDYL